MTRLSRLARVLLREAAHNLVALDMMRGSPAIYTTFAGYDKVAHHSGPWTRDAFRVLKRYDREVALLRDIARRKAPRPYEVILLSDHGQSFGATFLQRYGLDLKGFIQQHMPQGTSVAQSWGGDDGLPNVGAIGVELQNGTVAAFEELIGSHGGLGGEQTDAFLLHPPDMPAPETRNSEDFFHLLNARR